jgi:hypothetical protein
MLAMESRGVTRAVDSQYATNCASRLCHSTQTAFWAPVSRVIWARNDSSPCERRVQVAEIRRVYARAA